MLLMGLYKLTVGIILLYIVYKVVGSYLLPRITDRQLRRYKEDFYRRNPQIDRSAMEAREREKQENAPIIDKRHRKRRW